MDRFPLVVPARIGWRTARHRSVTDARPPTRLVVPAHRTFTPRLVADAHPRRKRR